MFAARIGKARWAWSIFCARSNVEREFSPQISALLAALERGLVERSEALRACVLAALSGEHALLLGPPGTAKSLLARRVHLAFSGARYFERLLTRFSVPEELFGPLSLAALEADRYERRIDGYLPAVEIAFVDEIFKANSAILNALLTLLNEREFDNGAQRMRVPLISMIAASNEWPDDGSLTAIADRFLITIAVSPVSQEGFALMLGSDEAAPQRETERLALDLSSLSQLRIHAESVKTAPQVFALLTRLRAALRARNHVVSDRRWKKSLQLMKMAAASCDRQEVSEWDSCVLRWTLTQGQADSGPFDDELAAELGVIDGFVPTQTQRAVEALSAQLDLDEMAKDLQFDGSGKLSFSRDAAERDATISAPRLSSALGAKKYGNHFIASRLAQVDSLLAAIDNYLHALTLRSDEFELTGRSHIWMVESFRVRVRAAFAHARETVFACRTELTQLRARVEALPRLAAPTHVAEPN
jgi:MoxR-like ATPase